MHMKRQELVKPLVATKAASYDQARDTDDT